MTSIDPTVARSIWFSPAIDDSQLDRDDGPYAAIICKVWESGAVNVVVFDRQGQSVGRQRVPMLQDGQFPLNPEAAFCAWMPYQKGQASKTDENTATLMRALNTQAALIWALETRVVALEQKVAKDWQPIPHFTPENCPELYGLAKTAQLTGTNTDQISGLVDMAHAVAKQEGTQPEPIEFLRHALTKGLDGVKEEQFTDRGV